MINSSRKLGETLGKLSQEQSDIKSNIAANEQDANAFIFSQEQLQINGLAIAIRKNYGDSSFIINHPTYGDIDSSTLLIDGDYVDEVPTLVYGSYASLTIVDNGSNILYGSGGAAGATSSSDNTTTYRSGYGFTDVVAQNLTLTGRAGSGALWARVVTPYSASNYYHGFWLYIKDASVLTRFENVVLRLGTSSSVFRTHSWSVNNLVVGWNVLVSDTKFSEATQTGGATPLTTVSYVGMGITTTGTLGSFSTGDLVYDDLCRWNTAVRALNDYLYDEAFF